MRRILGLAIVAACGGHAATPAPPPHNVGPTPGPATKIVTMERTACMGRCPEYTVTISDDGAVTWKGDANVAVIGERTSTIDPAKVQALVDAFVAARFMELDDSGQLPRGPSCHPVAGGGEECEGIGVTVCTDTPHAHLTFVHDGKTHATDDAHCGGETALMKLEELVDATAGTAAWRGGGDAP